MRWNVQFAVSICEGLLKVTLTVESFHCLVFVLGGGALKFRIHSVVGLNIFPENRSFKLEFIHRVYKKRLQQFNWSCDSLNKMHQRSQLAQ